MIKFQSVKRGTKFLFAGNYLCYHLTGDDEINVFSLLDARERQIRLSAHFDNIGEFGISLESISPYSQVCQGRLTRVNSKSFSDLADRIQITCGDLCYLYDLSYKSPTVVNEVSSTDMLLDPNHYVETGFKLFHLHDEGVKRSLE